MTTKAHKKSLLGDYSIQKASFPNLDSVFAAFDDPEFKKRSSRKRFHRVNQVLLQLILEAPQHSFLLPAVIEFIEKVNERKILRERYNISLFEFWLNQFSELNTQDNYIIRAKIAGKHLPREEYQAFFPIGMGKVFSGTHFIAAHLSPDVDTMVASFWGWLDAFAARICNSIHVWSLPGGPPDSPVTQIFKELFGTGIFTEVSRTTGSLTLSGIDLVTQKGVVKKRGNTSLGTLELNSGEKAIIFVDDNGHFLGDWHSTDVEPIRKIIIRFKSCLRWFENNLHVKLISLFAVKKLHIDAITPFLASIFDVSIAECEPVQEFTERQKKDLNDFFIKVVGLPEGLKSTFGQLNRALTQLSIFTLNEFQTELESLRTSDLFDKEGYLKEDRPTIFHRLEKIIHQLDQSIQHIRDYVEQLDVALKIKSKVFGMSSPSISLRNDVDDIRIKMKKQEYITVVIDEGNDKLFPIGVVWASTLQNQILGTVSFRDFCNQDEVKMASYLSPISVIDHHKTSLKTVSPPMAIIGDAQSCNVLIAELTLNINAKYSLGGMTSQMITNELKVIETMEESSSKIRLGQRLSQRKLVAGTCEDYFVHPDRELIEYICFLHAILDDTDLLTKVSMRDIECVVNLLNRAKSITLNKEVEIIHLDDIPKDKNFAKAAAKRILQNPEMHSLYSKVYASKEQEIEKNLQECNQEHFTSLFLDTKEQNGCCRVGQTKLFTCNFPIFRKNVSKLMDYWVRTAQEINQEQPEIDLHMHMISTIASSNEVFEDKVGHYNHQDEIWFWIPSKQKAYDHLASFLTAFQAAHHFESAHIEFLPSTPDDMKQLFERNCPDFKIKTAKSPNFPIVIFRFNAGMLNSRKAMITPYLPRLIS